MPYNECMEYLIVPILAAGVMVGLYLRKKNQPKMKLTPLARGLLWAGLILQGLYAAFWLMFGLEEITSSIAGGVVHLVPALSAILILWFARSLPLEGGLVLSVEGLLLGLYTTLVIDPGANRLPAILFAAAPALLSGLLLLWASALALQSASQK